MKIRGNEIVHMSGRGNVAITYNMFGLGNKYKVYKKVKFPGKIYWEYVIAFGTLGEARAYAGKIHDVATER